MANSSRVKSAERTMHVLSLLARHDGPLTTLEISSGVGMPKSTTHHLLNVMLEHGFVQYWRDQRVWTLGVAALEIGASYTRNGPLAREGRRFLQRLTERTGVTSHVAILQGTDVVYVDKREPQANGVRLVTEIGTRLPAHLTAVGRAILGALDGDEVDRTYEEYAWPLRTGAGPASLEELHPVLDRVRRDGVAEEVGTTTDGVACVAAPLRTMHGHVAGALGVAFMANLADEETLGALRDAVRETAAAFSAALGAS
ncbi:IclR family transcriptional regulator [Patulibacter sp. S7RM1-6]